MSNYVKITSTPGLLCGNTGIATGVTKALDCGNWKSVHMLFVRLVYDGSSVQGTIFIPTAYLLLQTGTFYMRFPVALNTNVNDGFGYICILSYTDTTITFKNDLSHTINVAIWGCN